MKMDIDHLDEHRALFLWHLDVRTASLARLSLFLQHSRNAHYSSHDFNRGFQGVFLCLFLGVSINLTQYHRRTCDRKYQ